MKIFKSKTLIAGIIMFIIGIYLFFNVKPNIEQLNRKHASWLVEVENKQRLCEISGGEEQRITGSDNLCWKDGKMIFVIKTGGY